MTRLRLVARNGRLIAQPPPPAVDPASPWAPLPYDVALPHFVSLEEIARRTKVALERAR